MSTSIAKINLDNLRHNFKEYNKLLGDTTKIIAVVKADGYGHGALPVCKIAAQEGIEDFAVSRIKEGIELKEAGVEGAIIILGGTLPSEMVLAVEYGLIPTIYNVEQIKALNDAVSTDDYGTRFHLKIETGMNRLGVKPGDGLEEFLDVLDGMDKVRMSGVYSHFATSDCDPVYTKSQYKKFTQAMRQIRARDYVPKTHISNSAAITSFDQFKLDYVRLGVGMYGLKPDGKDNINLKPVMSLHANIVHINKIEAEDTVSYGRTFTAKEEMIIAVLPIGYADGYPRTMGNKAQVLVHGQRCDVVGRVCMDHAMIDVTDVAGVECGDEVVLIGSQGDEKITAKELADLSSTIHYEIVTGIQKRIERVYVGGEEESTK